MAKHNGIVIRIGAAYDRVDINKDGKTLASFDRNAMRKDGNSKLQGALRREVVDTWAQMQEKRGASKLKRNAKRQGDLRDKARREYA